MPKVKLIIIFYLSLVLFLNLGCKTFEKNEWTIEPYYSKKGNPSFENNLINYIFNNLINSFMINNLIFKLF